VSTGCHQSLAAQPFLRCGRPCCQRPRRQRGWNCQMRGQRRPEKGLSMRLTGAVFWLDCTCCHDVCDLHEDRANHAAVLRFAIPSSSFDQTYLHQALQLQVCGHSWEPAHCHEPLQCLRLAEMKSVDVCADQRSRSGPVNRYSM